MKLVNKTRISGIFFIYVGILVLTAITINALTGVNVLKKGSDLADSTFDKSLSFFGIYDDFEKMKVEHSDITGLKSITRKRRNPDPAENINRPTAVYASYTYQPIPAEFQGVLTEEKKAEIRTKITDVSKMYLGRPYVYGGKGPKVFDCSGYTSFILRQFGIILSPACGFQSTEGKHVDLANAKVGDLLFFSAYGKGGVITHVGLILDNNADGITIIHANNHGVTIENVTKSFYWKNKILFARDVISAVTKPSI